MQGYRQYIGGILVCIPYAGLRPDSVASLQGTFLEAAQLCSEA